MAIKIPIKKIKFCTNVARTVTYKSLTDSVSFVFLETNAPAGVLSKNESPSFCTFEKTSIQRDFTSILKI